MKLTCGEGGVMFGKTEDLIIVLVIVLVLFGAKKLPELARSLGQSVKEVRKGFSEDADPARTKDQEESKTEV